MRRLWRAAGDPRARPLGRRGLLIDEKNSALAIVVGSVAIGMSIIVSSAIR